MVDCSCPFAALGFCSNTSILLLWRRRRRATLNLAMPLRKGRISASRLNGRKRPGEGRKAPQAATTSPRIDSRIFLFTTQNAEPYPDPKPAKPSTAQMTTTAPNFVPLRSKKGCWRLPQGRSSTNLKDSCSTLKEA